MTVTVSARGQMAIPASIRRHYGLDAGSKVELLDLGNEMIIIPLPKGGFRATRGVLKGIGSRDLLRARRRERRSEHAAA